MADLLCRQTTRNWYAGRNFTRFQRNWATQSADSSIRRNERLVLRGPLQRIGRNWQSRTTTCLKRSRIPNTEHWFHSTFKAMKSETTMNINVQSRSMDKSAITQAFSVKGCRWNDEIDCRCAGNRSTCRPTAASRWTLWPACAPCAAPERRRRATDWPCTSTAATPPWPTRVCRTPTATSLSVTKSSLRSSFRCASLDSNRLGYLSSG